MSIIQRSQDYAFSASHPKKADCIAKESIDLNRNESEKSLIRDLDICGYFLELSDLD